MKKVLIEFIIKKMLAEFFVQNFALLCILIGMIFISIQNIHSRNKESFYSLLIVGTTFILSIILALEYLGRVKCYTFLSTICAVLGYSIRPICLYLFIRLASQKKEHPLLFIIPLGVNFLIYCLALFINVPALRTLVFYYDLDSVNNVLVFKRGVLNFSSHIVSLFFLGYLIYLSFKRLKGKNKNDALAVLTCCLFVIVAVLLETFQVAQNLLNTIIAVSCVFYYLYIYVQYVRKDALTGLFDRKTFFTDIKRFDRKINAVAEIDMNGLKRINDTYGHEAGDVALKKVAEIIDSCLKKNMYSYRVGGDEFAIVAIDATEEDINEVTNTIKDRSKETKYDVSVGFAFTQNKDTHASELIKEADKKMYQDKEEFYKNSNIDRRRR